MIWKTWASRLEHVGTTFGTRDQNVVPTFLVSYAPRDCYDTTIPFEQVINPTSNSQGVMDCAIYSITRARVDG